MVHVLSWRRWLSRRSWTALLCGLASLSVVVDPAPALGQPPAKKSQPSAKADQGATKKAAPADDDQDAAPAAAPDVPGGPVADPIQTRRAAPMEIFKDETAEAILDLDKLTPVRGPAVDPIDVLKVKELAGQPNLPIDRTLIDKVVRGLAAQLTDRGSIQSLLEEPEEESDNAPAAKGAPKGVPRATPAG